MTDEWERKRLAAKLVVKTDMSMAEIGDVLDRDPDWVYNACLKPRDIDMSVETAERALDVLHELHGTHAAVDANGGIAVKRLAKETTGSRSGIAKYFRQHPKVVEGVGFKPGGGTITVFHPVAAAPPELQPDLDHYVDAAETGIEVRTDGGRPDPRTSPAEDLAEIDIRDYDDDASFIQHVNDVLSNGDRR